jgi:hypothetical protein
MQAPADKVDTVTPMEESIDAAISDSVSDEVVTRWVCLVESLDADGTRGLWTATSDGVMAWDTVGMLDHALDLQRGRTYAEIAQQLRGD